MAGLAHVITKPDGSFESTMTLVSTIISLAQALKLKVVAEGVDSGHHAAPPAMR